MLEESQERDHPTAGQVAWRRNMIVTGINTSDQPVLIHNDTIVTYVGGGSWMVGRLPDVTEDPVELLKCQFGFVGQTDDLKELHGQALQHYHMLCEEFRNRRGENDPKLY